MGGQVSAGSRKPTKQFSLYDAIIFESRSSDSLHVLTQGDWYKVDGSYVDGIKKQIEQIQIAPFDLPPAIKSPREMEGDYNLRAAAESSGHLACLDTKCVKFGGKYSKIEICDLLSKGKHFIHIKVGTKSALLSHLFNQGVVSAQLMLQSEFRVLAAVQAPDDHKNIFGDDFHPNTTSVVFGIITSSDEEVAEALPFFSQQSLANTKRLLESLGYTVQLKKIPYTAT